MLAFAAINRRVRCGTGIITAAGTVGLMNRPAPALPVVYYSRDGQGEGIPAGGASFNGPE